VGASRMCDAVITALEDPARLSLFEPIQTDHVTARDQAMLECDQAIVERDQAIVERDQAIVERDQAIARTNALEASRTWRMMTGYRRLRERVG